MAKSYTINIIDGTATQAIKEGTYTATSTTKGYDNTSLEPTTIEVDRTSKTLNFELIADGTLTLHVTDTGTPQGTPIVGAIFKRCDKNGVEYGTEKVTDLNGNAILNNVPYSQEETINIYYKQIQSDGNHNFDTELMTVNLTDLTKTIEVTNPAAQTQTLTLTDKSYENLPIENGTITLN